MQRFEDQACELLFKRGVRTASDGPDCLRVVTGQQIRNAARTCYAGETTLKSYTDNERWQITKTLDGRWLVMDKSRVRQSVT